MRKSAALPAWKAKAAVTAVAYYNEHDKFAAAWLRSLIDAGLIAYGDVDERDIRDVEPRELTKYRQCHFFAGIGVWSYALRRGGWPDERPVWTGSCPCQPFSAAGQGGGFADERHLWPAFFHLIEAVRPGVVLGEQVASKDGLAWLDLVQADMEGTGHTFGAVDTCSAGFGAPHIRQRLYWMAHTEGGGSRPGFCDNGTREIGGHEFADGSGVRVVADAYCAVSEQLAWPGTRPIETSGTRARGEPHRSGEAGGLANIARGRRGELGRTVEQGEIRHAYSSGDAPGRMAYADGGDASAKRIQRQQQHGQQSTDSVFSGRGYQGIGYNGGPELEGPGPVNGVWKNADWLLCRDGKWRPVEPGTFPLAHGAPARVGRLRGYGNAINAEHATEFVVAVREALEW